MYNLSGRKGLWLILEEIGFRKLAITNAYFELVVFNRYIIQGNFTVTVFSESMHGLFM